MVSGKKCEQGHCSTTNDRVWSGSQVCRVSIRRGGRLLASVHAGAGAVMTGDWRGKLRASDSRFKAAAFEGDGGEERVFALPVYTLTFICMYVHTLTTPQPNRAKCNKKNSYWICICKHFHPIFDPVITKLNMRVYRGLIRLSITTSLFG